MILQTETGQALPTAVAVPAGSDGLALYAVDENGVPVECFFVLSPTGGQSSNGKGTTFFGGRNSSFFNGTLNGVAGQPTVTVGPAYSCVYSSPVDPLLLDGPIYCTLIAIPVSGGPARQLMITVPVHVPSIF